MAEDGLLLRIVSRKWRAKLAFRYDRCKMQVFPKGRVDEELRAEHQPVTLRPWPLTLGPPVSAGTGAGSVAGQGSRAEGPPRS